jgi:hypothetical protein
MALCAGAALYGREQAPLQQAIAFGAASLPLAAAAAWVDLRWSSFLRAAGEVK